MPSGRPPPAPPTSPPASTAPTPTVTVLVHNRFAPAADRWQPLPPPQQQPHPAQPPPSTSTAAPFPPHLPPSAYPVTALAALPTLPAAHHFNVLVVVLSTPCSTTTSSSASSSITTTISVSDASKPLHTLIAWGPARAALLHTLRPGDLALVTSLRPSRSAPGTLAQLTPSSAVHNFAQLDTRLPPTLSPALCSALVRLQSLLHSRYPHLRAPSSTAAAAAASSSSADPPLADLDALDATPTATSQPVALVARLLAVERPASRGGTPGATQLVVAQRPGQAVRIALAADASPRLFWGTLDAARQPGAVLVFAGLGRPATATGAADSAALLARTPPAHARAPSSTSQRELLAAAAVAARFEIAAEPAPADQAEIRFSQVSQVSQLPRQARDGSTLHLRARVLAVELPTPLVMRTCQHCGTAVEAAATAAAAPSCRRCMAAPEKSDKHHSFAWELQLCAALALLEDSHGRRLQATLPGAVLAQLTACPPSTDPELAVRLHAACRALEAPPRLALDMVLTYHHDADEHGFGLDTRLTIDQVASIWE